MLRVKFFVHASFLVEYKGVTLLTDPWLGDQGAFLGSWFQFPRFDRLDLDEARRVDYIYLSHEHQDHFDPGFLKTVRKDCKFLIPDYANGYLKNELNKLGFNTIIALNDSDELELVEDFKVKIIKAENPFWDDSAIIIKTSDGVILNTNDLKYSAAQAEDIKAYTNGGADLHFLQFSGATWHPLAYENYSNEERVVHAHKHINNKFNNVVRMTQFAHSKSIVPCAGPPCFLDNDLYSVNFDPATIFPTQIDFETFLKGRDVNFDVLHMLPGDEICLKNRAIVSKTENQQKLNEIYQDKETYLSDYKALRENNIAKNKLRDNVKVSDELFERFQAYMQPLVSVSPFFRNKINSRVLFHILGEKGGQWIVDFTKDADSVYEYQGEDYSYRFTFESRYMELLITKQLHWEDFFLSLRFKAYRDPDIYNEYLIALLKFGNIRDIKRLEQFYLKKTIDEFIQIDCNGKRYEIQKYCPHAGELLECADLTGNILTCPRHGWRFNVETGECIEGRANLMTRLVGKSVELAE